MLEIITSHYTNILIAALIFMPVEKLLPRNKQNILRNNLSMDAAFTFLGALITIIGYLVIITAGVIILSPFVPAGVQDYVGAQHVLIQILAIALIADVWYYFMHRLSHRLPALWRFHAIHHSIEDCLLYTSPSPRD